MRLIGEGFPFPEPREAPYPRTHGFGLCILLEWVVMHAEEPGELYEIPGYSNLGFPWRLFSWSIAARDLILKTQTTFPS